jgi:hypothetical protein
MLTVSSWGWRVVLVSEEEYERLKAGDRKRLFGRLFRNGMSADHAIP